MGLNKKKKLKVPFKFTVEYYCSPNGKESYYHGWIDDYRKCMAIGNSPEEVEFLLKHKFKKEILELLSGN